MVNKSLWQIFNEIATEYGVQRLQFELKRVYQTNISISQLYRYGEDPETTGTELPSSLYIPITLITGNDAILRYFAEACNKCLIDLPSIKKIPIKNQNVELSKAIRECSDVFQTASKVLIDGNISEDEKKILEEQCLEAVAQILRFNAGFQNA
jgi:hypothetical protein